MVDEYGVVGVGWIWRSVEVTGSGKWALGLCFPEVMGRCLSCSQRRKRESAQTETVQGWAILPGVGGYLGSCGWTRQNVGTFWYPIQRNDPEVKRVPPYRICEAPAKDSNTKWNGREQWRGREPQYTEGVVNVRVC